MKYKLTLLLFIVFVQSFAQDKIQFELLKNSTQIRVVPLGESGFAFVNWVAGGELLIKKVDNDLKAVWDSSVQIPYDAEYLEEYVVNNFLYILFQQKKSNLYLVLKVSMGFAANQKFQIQSLPNFTVTHFKPADNFICLGGNVDKESYMIFFDEVKLSTKFISASLNGETNLQTIDVKDDIIVTSFINFDKIENSMFSRIYSKTGKMISSAKIESDDRYQFLSAKFFEEAGTKLIVGNYGWKGNDASKITSSQGIYITKLADKINTKYYSFDKFKNFFNFLNDKEQAKIEKQVQKQIENGNEYRFDYRLLINEIGTFQDNLVLTADVFKPEFRNNSFSNPYGYGSSLFYPYSMLSSSMLYYGRYNPFYNGYNGSSSYVFDGFRYIEGIVLMINQKGELMWDQSVKYNKLKYYKLKQHINLNDNAERVIVSYKDKNNLLVDEFTPKGNLAKSAVLENKSKPVNDTKRTTNKEELFEYWYDNYFINWSIENGQDNNSKKQICVIEKITF